MLRVLCLQLWFRVSPGVLCGRIFEAYAESMGIELGSVQVSGPSATVPTLVPYRYQDFIRRTTLCGRTTNFCAHRISYLFVTCVERFCCGTGTRTAFVSFLAEGKGAPSPWKDAEDL